MHVLVVQPVGNSGEQPRRANCFCLKPAFLFRAFRPLPMLGAQQLKFLSWPQAFMVCPDVFLVLLVFVKIFGSLRTGSAPSENAQGVSQAPLTL